MRHHLARAVEMSPLAVAALVCCAIGLAACSSAGNTGTGPQSSGVSAGIKFADCMRVHGVPNFPDPGPSRELPIMRSPAFQSAQKSCQHLLGAGLSSGPPSAQARAQLLQISECMRRHGISEFPDPRAGSPPSSLTGYSLILGMRGYILAIPSSIDPSSPRFKQAVTACHFGPRSSR
jgi:hypothetical protein